VSDKFILFVETREPRKNLDALIRAYEELPERIHGVRPAKRIDIAIEAFNELKLPLKIAGDGPERKALESTAESIIEFLGWAEDARFAELYASCQALVFPGEEDFGIVPLEAQASGRPRL
jgi:glycosyltransferase involved in cell wall biosynthesis